MKKILMLSAISLIAAISAEVSMAVAGTEDSGTINLSLDLGSSTAIQTLEATPGSGFIDNVTLTTTDNNDGTRTMDDKPLGNISFSGDNIPTNISNCKVTFTGTNDSTSFFYLKKSGTTDTVKYRLEAKVAKNSTSVPASITSIFPTLNIYVPPIANGNGLNKCDINMTGLKVKAYNQDLTSKNGTYTDTITYTITVI